MLSFFSATIMWSVGAHAEMMLLPPSQGNTTAKPREIVYRERTEIDFEGVEVAGELVKPQGRNTLEETPPISPRLRLVIRREMGER